MDTGLKRLLSPVLDPLGNIVMTSRLADLGLAHRHGLRTRRLVALTFDDGPVQGGTEDVLDALEQQAALATFFFVGANMQMHPDIVRRAAAAGHAIGLHSMNHSRIDTVLPYATGHIDACAAALTAALGRAPALYRPPWGWMTPWEALRLRRHGVAIIRWDIETPDSKVPCPPAEILVAWALDRVQPGSIIVFHDGMTHAARHDKPETARAVRLLVPALRARGYTLVTVSELLGIPAYREVESAAVVRGGNIEPPVTVSRGA